MSGDAKPWTDAEIERLKEAWANPNMRLSAMAGYIGGGHTRNAVVGKAHRLNLPMRRIAKIGLQAPADRASPRPRTPIVSSGNPPGRPKGSFTRPWAERTAEQRMKANMPPAGRAVQAGDAAARPVTAPSMIPAQSPAVAAGGSLFSAPIEPVYPETPASPLSEPGVPYSGTLFTSPIEPEAIATGPEAIATLSWSGAGIRYLELRDDHCRAFIGEGPAGSDVNWIAPISCGETVVNGISYCAKHASMFFAAPTKRWR